jgi:(S)-2-hydroxyglutarate dehydrogenase
MRYAVVGGGIVGLSIAIAILERKLGAVTIFDKETNLGLHASTRNSGVIHSGIYYSSDSLKAKFSRAGNEEIKKLCHDNGLRLQEKGKLILSQNLESENQLSVLETRGVANGVPFERLERKELNRFALGARTHDTFIRVLSTAVANPHEVFGVLHKKFLSLGGAVQLVSKVRIDHPDEELNHSINGSKFDYLINAAGAGAVELARPFGLGLDYLVTPFLGVYWGVESSKLPLSLPLYPTPHPINPFLGVHITPTPFGYTKIGPSAIPVLGKEQYRWNQGFSMSDLAESTRAYMRIALGRSHSLTQMIRTEIPKFSLATMVKEASQLLPNVAPIKDWKATPGGIRAQIVDRDGTLIQDFLVEQTKNSLHVLNAVSPGWTSAIPFGRWIVDAYIDT